MADPNAPISDTPQTTQHRRRGSSFAGQNFADLYEAARSRQTSASDVNGGAVPAASPQFPSGSISSAFQAHRRRLSLTTVGLATSPNNQVSPFAGLGAHRDSTTSTSTVSIDESAVEDDPGAALGTQSGATPFARRMSFGARALRDAKTGPGTSRAGRSMNGRSSLSHSPSQKHALPVPWSADGGGAKTAPPGPPGRGDSMAWVDSFANRGDRRASITFPREMPSNTYKGRAQSVAGTQPTPVTQPMPSRAVPDAYSERLLRGEVDF